jgi:hypothetical protein
MSGQPRDSDGWDDQRLGAAFRARADTAPRPLSADLVEETLARVRRVETRRSRFAARSLVGLATAAAVLVAVLVFGVSTLGPSIGPGGSPSASIGTPSQPIASVPSGSARAPGLGVAALPLLDVAGAVAIRDGGFDDREIRVQGFFAGIPVIYCALMLGPVNPTRTDCAPATITQNRVPLSKAGSTAEDPGATFLASFAVVGVPDASAPTLPPTTNGSPRSAADGVTMLTLVGHFDDRRADLCPAQQVPRCRDTFMVDRIDAVGPTALETRTYDASRDVSGGTTNLHPRRTPDAVEALLRPIDPAFTILSRRLQTANLLTAIEPAWPTEAPAWADNIPTDQRITWLVTAMSGPDSTGPATVRTFVIDDRTGTILEIDRTGISLTWVSPEPTLSDASSSIPPGVLVECGELAASDCGPAADAALVAVAGQTGTVTRIELGSGVYCPTPGLLFANTSCPGGAISPLPGGKALGHALVTVGDSPEQAYLNLWRSDSVIHGYFIARAIVPSAQP